MDRAQGEDGHRYFEEMAVAHVVGGLDDAEGRVFRAHLLECSECRARVYELRTIAHDLADVERDERRVRAAKAIETKRRESDDDDLGPVDPPVGTRSSRIALLLGVSLLLLLSAWNFSLRSANTQLTDQAEDLVAASAIMQFGVAWGVEQAREGVNGQVREHDGQLAALLENLNDQRVYGLYYLDGGGEVITRQSKQPTGNRLFAPPIPQSGAIVRVLITDPGEGNLPPEVPQADRVIFEALAPTNV